MLNIAIEYCRRGWNPVPVVFKGKRPIGDAWQHRRITEETAPQYFNGAGYNIGVQLGLSSHGLTDVDVDCSEALRIAPYVLPATKAIFGRQSKRNSHWLYVTGLAAKYDQAAIQLRDPRTRSVLVELRTGGGEKGAQTVFPGSTHEGGEPIVWEKDHNAEPAQIDSDELDRKVRLLAACALLARYWPPKPLPNESGSRHNAALIVGGFLSRCGHRRSLLREYVGAIARSAGDEEWRDRRKAAEDAAIAHGAGKHTYGFNGLAEMFGRDLAERIAEWLDYIGGDEQPSKLEPDAAEAPQKAAANLGEWDAGNDPGPIPPRQWLLGNQFCRKFISSLVATGGTGKSALRLLQFISMALGRPLTGQHIFRRCRVLLISLEDDRDELERRIDAVLKFYNINRAELKGWLFCATPRLVKLAEMRNKIRSLGGLETMVRAAIRRRSPDIVGLDPFIKTHGLAENDAADMDFVCDLLAEMAIENNIAIDSPHHTRKGLASPGDADMGRGSGGIKDAGRLVYTLTPMSENEAKLFDISIEDRLLYVRLDSAKVNIVRRGGKATWFKLVGVQIDNGTSEYPNGDEVQTVIPWSPPETWANVSSVTLNAALTEIDEGLPPGQRYSSAPNAKDRAAWQVVQKHCPNKTEGQCREMIRTWIKTGLLYNREYTDPIDRKDRAGLYVDSSKRPS